MSASSLPAHQGLVAVTDTKPGAANAGFFVSTRDSAENPPLTADAQDRLSVTDGDTLIINGERIRLRSEAGPIDAPELGKAKCPLELFRAQAARERLAQIMAPQDFSLDRRGLDKYGRTVAVVYADGEDVGAKLVAEGHAKMWMSLRRADRPTWCVG